MLSVRYAPAILIYYSENDQTNGKKAIILHSLKSSQEDINMQGAQSKGHPTVISAEKVCILKREGVLTLSHAGESLTYKYLVVQYSNTF